MEYIARHEYMLDRIEVVQEMLYYIMCFTIVMSQFCKITVPITYHCGL